MEMRKFIDTKLNDNTSQCPFGTGEKDKFRFIW
jgi:hypothetical protein